MRTPVLFVVILSIVYGKDHNNHGHHHTAAPPPTTTVLPNVDPVSIINQHIAAEVEHLWTQMDYNQDGVFGRDDLQHFIHGYDTNGDGHVQRLEFLDHFTKDDPGLSMVGEGLFLEFDVNLDHIVDDSDLDGIHNKVDTSKNGIVDKAEFSAYFQQVMTYQTFDRVPVAELRMTGLCKV